MRAGTMRHRLVIEQPVMSDDDASIESWVPVTTVAASIEPLTGRERLSADQLQGETDTRIRFRWSPRVAGITAAWRGRHGSVIYNIGSIADAKLRHRELELLCTSGVNEG